MKTAVLIPCYNESKTIEKVVKDFKNILPNADIYVYDNNSTDMTAQIAQAAGVIVRSEKKQGKGTFVCTPKIDVRSPNFTMMCVTNHKVPSSKIIKIVKQPASERDIRELNLAPGAEVIYLLRLLFADGEPVMVEHNFFPERFSKLLETELRLLQSK